MIFTCSTCIAYLPACGGHRRGTVTGSALSKHPDKSQRNTHIVTYTQEEREREGRREGEINTLTDTL